MVVLTPNNQLEAGAPIVAAAITGTLPNPLSDEYELLPWHRQKRTVTGLSKPCAAVCSWIIEVDPSKIDNIVGRVPGDHLKRIAEKTSYAVEDILHPPNRLDSESEETDSPGA